MNWHRRITHLYINKSISVSYYFFFKLKLKWMKIFAVASKLMALVVSCFDMTIEKNWWVSKIYNCFTKMDVFRRIWSFCLFLVKKFNLYRISLPWPHTYNAIAHYPIQYRTVDIITLKSFNFHQFSFPFTCFSVIFFAVLLFSWFIIMNHILDVLS